MCSLAANPFNARFHSTLLKAAAHTILCNLGLLCVSLCVCERERERQGSDLFWSLFLPVGAEGSQ